MALGSRIGASRGAGRLAGVAIMALAGWGASVPAAVAEGQCPSVDVAALPARPTLDAKMHERLSKTLEQHIDVRLERFTDWRKGMRLERVLKGTGELPAVVATKPLNAETFGAAGTRRLVCLSDGGIALEEVVEEQPSYFSYIVWGYTTPKAMGIAYGFGEFWYEPQGEATQVRWRYSFKLKGDTFPGYLGPVGRWLFQRIFLDTTYERFMRSALEAQAEEAVAATRR
jgi:hypothetical protein